uniref:Cytochrome P450 n=1 Tax=Nothapodytes nimmoniana TaxID=159386 RepID=A0A7L7RBF2_NOTNI|nr:cytochrome P450 [Nothapodytes nimmoniana]
MEIWFIIVTICLAALLKFITNFFNQCNNKRKLPPGPRNIPVIGDFLWLRKSFSELEPFLRELISKYGPLVTLRIGSRPAIFVGSHSLAHRALIQNGAVFCDRPRAIATGRVLNSNQHNVSSAVYGPLWRLLRRNLNSEILHPSRVKSFSHARRSVLGILIRRLLEAESESAPVKAVDHFQYAMFCLLVLMCFGDKLDEDQIKRVESVQRDLLLSFQRFNILNFWPGVGKIVFRKRWSELYQLRRNQENVLIPLIHDRIKSKQERERKRRTDKSDNGVGDEEDGIVAYVDTLLDLELPDEKRKINDGEMVSLCGEFLSAGTDTTSTTFQWIMANLVKYPQIQAKLYEEISSIMGEPPSLQLSKGKEENIVFVKEDDLQKMTYLKAVVLEALRRHPPGHFVLPHAVTEDVELDGYLVPKNASVNFMVAEMGLDPKVWENPTEFKPERFLMSANDDDKNGGELFDITGSREIKMMPFGAGRRICPGAGLALLHLEYFVANLVWYFEWKAVDGDDVDLSEKQEFTIVMKNPLRAHITARVK